jgi:hypothetical protein
MMSHVDKSWKPEMLGAWVTWARIGLGQTIYALYVPNYYFPVGVVWGVGDGNGCFRVGGSFVQPWARRHGVRTRINQTIFEHWDVIHTASGTAKEGGLQFLKASGYKWHKQARIFYLAKPNRKKKVH